MISRAEALEMRNYMAGNDSLAENDPYKTEDDTNTVDVFKESFKFYKRKKPPPDLTDVINFSNPDPSIVSKMTLLLEEDECDMQCVLPVNEWNVWQLNNHPGFYVIQNPFRQGYQRYWVKLSLEDFPCKPNITNLEAHGHVAPDCNLWKESLETLEDQKRFQKLRWATLGYHHNWDTKVYSDDHQGPFPEDLGCLCQYIAKALGFKSYKAEAAILNYYHLDSTLSGHTDHSELDHEAPLISFSFGQKAIFLFGGTTKQVKPSAMFVTSGDIVIMSGQSRLAYHAVPKILTPEGELDCFIMPDNNKTSELSDVPAEKAIQLGSCIESKKDCKCAICDHNIEMFRTLQTTDWEPFAQYLSTSRINMNVRQVFPGVEQKH